MKSIVLLENGKLEVLEKPIPQYADDEYLIKILNVGVCNSDIFRAFHQGAYHYPLIMGHEFCGEIVECGAATSRLKKGQRVVVFPLIPCRNCESCQREEWVFCSNYDYYGSRRDGAYQELLAVKEWNLIPIDDSIRPNLACLVEPIAVAVSATNKLVASADSSNSVLVMGSGIIGLAAAIILNENNWHVAVVDRNQFKLNIVRDLGLKTLQLDELEEHVGKFGAVLECTGSDRMYSESIKVAKQGANIIWLGNIQKELVLEKNLVSSILRKELVIRGVWNSTYKGGTHDDWSQAIEFISRHQEQLALLITHEIGVDDVPSLLQKMYDIKTNYKEHDIMKVTISFS